nr:PREDICTED: acylphosphatase-2-like [Lepisosteus oculatus]
MSSASGLVSVDYEVFGDVQGHKSAALTCPLEVVFQLLGSLNVWVRQRRCGGPAQTKAATATEEIKSPFLEFGGGGGRDRKRRFETDSRETFLRGPRKDWLRRIGSPMSRIDKATFSNEREIPALEFKSFTTKY